MFDSMETAAPREDASPWDEVLDEATLAHVLEQFEADLAGEVAAAGGHGAVPADPAGVEYPPEELRWIGDDLALLGPADDLAHVEYLAAGAASLPPGAEAAGLLEHLTSPPVAATLTAAARVDLLVAAERLGRWVSAISMRLLVEHVGAVELPDHAPTDWSGVEQRGRVADVAVACETSENHVRDRWALGRRLLRPGAVLEQTGRALTAGQISQRHAQVLVETTAVLDDDYIRQVEQSVLGKAVGRNPARFRQICRRAVLRCDPSSAVRRHEVARQERAVTWWPEDDGMARLQVYGPAPELMAVHGALDLLAGRGAAGDPRTAGARRFDALLELCLAAVTPDMDLPRPSEGVSDDRATTDTAVDDPSATGVDRRRPRCGTKPAVQAQIVVDLATLLGLADHPGELRGYGPIPAGLAREWLAEATTWRRLVTDPVTGHLLDYGPVVRLAPPRLRDFVLARDATCTAPGCNRRASGRGVEIDHHPPWRSDGSGGSASASATGALCAHHHHLKTHGHWDVLEREHGTTTWRSPSGREHRVRPEPVLPP